MEEERPSTEIATFGAGCFWDSEARFRRVEGVIATRVGFMGGITLHPTYEEVCSRITGHVEVVMVVYDPTKVSYHALLDIFWSIIDSSSQEQDTTRQGDHERSAIFFHSKEQETAALLSMVKREREGFSISLGKIGISPASEFYEADEHHQQYYEKCGQGYAAVPRYYD